MLILPPSIVDGRVLGENRDAALALQIIRVHDALGNLLIGAESAGLAEHGVHERGFAMVDVGDDGDIAYRLPHKILIPFAWSGRAKGGYNQPASQETRAACFSGKREFSLAPQIAASFHSTSLFRFHFRVFCSLGRTVPASRSSAAYPIEQLHAECSTHHGATISLSDPPCVLHCGVPELNADNLPRVAPVCGNMRIKAACCRPSSFRFCRSVPGSGAE